MYLYSLMFSAGGTVREVLDVYQSALSEPLAPVTSTDGGWWEWWDKTDTVETTVGPASEGDVYFSRGAGGFDAAVTCNLWISKMPDVDHAAVFRNALSGAVAVCDAFGCDCTYITQEFVLFTVISGRVIFNQAAGVTDEERLRGFSRPYSVKIFPVL
ncbi:hypothetical protein HI113_14395 [Corallococcus exiguus]|uniref:hypothetical protein n=1 Tax=Corallococcus exiguus TaxID=83462 RepID=UPI001473DAEC|nr:hypothetical protein [Corallococcus exiguus]NNB95086.1 hypothetical protein [Corallococcus exiguus]NPD26621.1 hypothetical protein [Corallococcus exiguus]